MEQYWIDYEEYMRNLPEVQEELNELGKAITLVMSLKKAEDDIGDQESFDAYQESNELGKAITLVMSLKKAEDFQTDEHTSGRGGSARFAHHLHPREAAFGSGWRYGDHSIRLSQCRDVVQPPVFVTAALKRK